MNDAIKEKLLSFPALKEDLHSCIPATIDIEKNIKDKIRLVQIGEEIEELLSKVPKAGSVLIKYIDEKISELDTERKALQEKIITPDITDTNDRLKQITNHVKVWETLSFEDRQAVVDILIKVIRIADGSIEITWNI